MNEQLLKKLDETIDVIFYLIIEKMLKRIREKENIIFC